LGKTSGAKRERVTGGWGKVPMEELRGLHSSPSIVKVIRLRYMRGGTYSTKEKLENGYRVLVGETGGKEPH
jgi:hypothetical protein